MCGSSSTTTSSTIWLTGSLLGGSCISGGLATATTTTTPTTTGSPTTTTAFLLTTRTTPLLILLGTTTAFLLGDAYQIKLAASFTGSPEGWRGERERTYRRGVRREGPWNASIHTLAQLGRGAKRMMPFNKVSIIMMVLLHLLVVTADLYMQVD